MAVIKQIASENPQLEFADLQMKLGSKGPYEDFVLSKNAVEIAGQGYKRHFINPDELIKLADSTIAVSNQWGVGNIENFIDRARAIGQEITPV